MDGTKENKKKGTWTVPVKDDQGNIVYQQYQFRTRQLAREAVPRINQEPDVAGQNLHAVQPRSRNYFVQDE